MKNFPLGLLLVTVTLGISGGRAPTSDPVPPEIYQRWHNQQSYYALIEIIDAHLDPNFHRVVKEDVLTFLGKPNWGTINQDTNRVWGYQGLGRHIPQQHIVLLIFSTNDVLSSLDWISE